MNLDGIEVIGLVDVLDEKGNKVGEYIVNLVIGEVIFILIDKIYIGKVILVKV